MCLKTQIFFFSSTEHQATRSLVNIKTKLTSQLHTRCDTRIFGVDTTGSRSPLLLERLPAPRINTDTEHGGRRVTTRVVLNTSHRNYDQIHKKGVFDTYLRPAVGPEGPGSRQMFCEYERQMFDQMFATNVSDKCFTKCLRQMFASMIDQMFATTLHFLACRRQHLRHHLYTGLHQFDRAAKD